MKLKTNIFRFKIIPVLLFLISLNISAQEVNENLETFSEIKTFNAVEVEIIPSTENRIEITGHSKNEVKYEIVDNRLEIRLSLDNIWSKDNTKIYIYAKTIQTIDANEGSIIEVRDVLSGEELEFRVQEGASIIANVNTGKIVSKSITGGRLIMEGKANEQDVEINTGGQYDARSLKTESTTIKAGTAGKAEIFATTYVKAKATLGGTIKIYGNPEEVDYKTSLGGRIL